MLNVAHNFMQYQYLELFMHLILLVLLIISMIFMDIRFD